MKGNTVPVDSRTADWPRKVAAAINGLLSSRQPFQKLASAPPNPVVGESYYDTAMNKVRTWDGAVWNNHF